MSTACGNNGEIIKTYVVESDLCIINTDELNSCSLTGITLTDSILPSGSTINLGTPSRRFRDVNTISGTSTIWTSTDKVITPTLDLGLDLSGNTRQITANNSIIQDDILWGGEF